MMKTQYAFMILLLTWMMSGSLQASGPDYSFSLECPGDVTVSCTDELWDLSIYGKAYIYEHYVKRDAGPPTRVERDLNACGVGEIRRIWEVEDPNWNIVSCTQTIYVGAQGGFGEDDIIWPESFDTSGCSVELDPYKLPKKYSIPRFKHVPCSKPAYSYKDRVFTVNGGCKKIMRSWEVIDCCSWNPDDPWGNGIWKHYQIIKIIQKDTPTIKHCPKKILVDAKSCDGTFVDLDTVTAVDKCGNNLKVWHNSPFADTSRGPDATGTYPIGTTKFYYIIKYACGKTIKCPVEITVKNNLQPRVYCRNGVVTTLMGIDTDGDGVNDEGMVELWAKDLDKGSTPKCGGKRLWFSFSSDTSEMSRIFTCDNVGENEVQVWVTDEFGNQTYCVTKVIIQNNAARIKDCMPDSLRPKINTLTGVISERDGSPMAKALVTLEDTHGELIKTISWDTSIVETRDTFVRSGNTYVRIHWDTTVVEHIDSSYQKKVYEILSGSSGEYRLDSIPKGKSYSLSVSMKGDPMEEVTTADLLMLMKVLNGIASFRSPYDYIAADLDENGVVDHKDYELLLSALLPFGQEKEGFRAWKFIDKNKSIDETRPINYDRVEHCVFNPLDADHNDMDFVAVKLGDIDRVKYHRPWFRETSTTTMTIGKALQGRASDMVIPVFLDKGGKTSGRLILQLPDSWMHHIRLEDGTASVRFERDDRTGRIAVLWLDPFEHPRDAVLFYLHVVHTAIGPEKLIPKQQSEDLELAYCIDRDGFIEPITLRIQGREQTLPSIRKPVISPNPFWDILSIRFPEAVIGEPCSLELYDFTGRKVREWQTVASEKGLHLRISEEIPGHVFILRVQTDAHVYSTKLIRIRQ